MTSFLSVTAVLEGMAARLALSPSCLCMSTWIMSSRSEGKEDVGRWQRSMEQGTNICKFQEVRSRGEGTH